MSIMFMPRHALLLNAISGIKLSLHMNAQQAMLHAPGHTHTPKEEQETVYQLDSLKGLLHSTDEKNNSSFDALHAKIAGIHEEAGGPYTIMNCMVYQYITMICTMI